MVAFRGTFPQHRANRPGPGSHTIPTFPDASPVLPCGAAFTMAAGRDIKAARKARTGPGSYHPRLSLTGPIQPCYGFGRAKRLLNDDGTGAGSERKADSKAEPRLAQGDNHIFNKAPGWGFGTEEKFFGAPHSDSRSSRMPGPGEHNPSDHMTSTASAAPSWRMSKPPRHSSETPRRASADAPGPGNYRPEESFKAISKEKAAPRFGFGTTARMKYEHHKVKMPGPGAYSTSNKTRTGHATTGSSPKWSMSGRHDVEVQILGSLSS